MNRPAKTGDPTERALAARFAQLRVAERAEAPDFSAEVSLASVSVPASNYRPLVAAALAAGIAAFALFFVMQEPAQDPGELYASIMAANEISTDQLMLASPGLLPEVTGSPVVYEIEMPTLQQEGGGK